ncbi:MAG: methionyl-tRNA formyltransferase [Candidatus Buchananbacteria bacterium]
MNNSKPTKIIFWGTPEFALPSLRALINNPAYQILGVITQPDKPIGRKQILTPPPIKLLANQAGLKIWQPLDVKDPALIAELKNLAPDLMILVAYGKIIPLAILNIPPLGIINLHPSLLPKYRGPSPIATAILNGETKTGLTIMLLDQQMDHGPILAQQQIALDQTETQESLTKNLAELGAQLLLKTLPQYLDQKIIPQVQADDQATLCKIIKKTAGLIDWSKPAQVINQQIRALHPWPGTYFTAQKASQTIRIKIMPPIKILDQQTNQLPGTFFKHHNSLAIACGQNAVLVEKIQPEGKKILTAAEFIAGYSWLLN